MTSRGAIADRILVCMADLVPILLTLAAFAAVMVGLMWLTRRSRGRRVGSSVTGPFEEIWHPAAHRARVEIEIQDERATEFPAPGDPLFGEKA